MSLVKRFNDERLILTLDAGGTNFNFAAFKNAKKIGNEFNIQINKDDDTFFGDDPKRALDLIVSGFNFLIDQFDEKPFAISLAFPGPCDYKAGVTLNEGNLPVFSGGVALGPYLEHIFKIPTFMNNDGDLYTYGEAQFGLFANSNFNSLIGLTLGTGVGGGFYFEGKMLRGETSNALEVWTTRNGIDTHTFTEEGLGKRALINFYGDKNLSGADLFKIAKGELDGNQKLALEAFEKYGRVLGELIADLVSLFDAPIVLGGGISKGYEFFYKSMLLTIQGSIKSLEGVEKSRIVQECYFIHSAEALQSNLQSDISSTTIPTTDIEVEYRKKKRIPISIGTLDSNRAVQLGAYSYALNQLDKSHN